jgi:hypothetical protein
MKRSRTCRVLSALATAAMTLSLVAAAPPGRATAGPAGPPADVGPCDPIDDGACLLPFPNDRFTAPADTPTRLRVDLPVEGMPVNARGVPVDPTEYNRNDGFSPGAMALADVPGLDLQATFGLPAGVEVLDRPHLSLAPDAPIVLLDLDTGARVPYLAELDHHPGAVAAGRQLLIVRPLEVLHGGHRYAVALRDLKDADGLTIEPDPVFAWYRGDRAGGPPVGVEPSRTAEFNRLFRDLRKAGVDRRDLYLAWSFTVASDQNVTGRAVHLRDEAFAALGDTDLADGEVAGDAPSFTVGQVLDAPNATTQRRVSGTVLVPNFLHAPALPPAGPDGGVPLEALLFATNARFDYGVTEPGPMALPQRNQAAPWLSVPYVCNLPAAATADDPADPMLYGHGLLGNRTQANGFSTELLRARNFAPCGVDFAGMSTFDQPNVAQILQDLSRFGPMPDRIQQGFLNFTFVGRALSHPDGLAAHPAFQNASGEPLIDVDTLSYTGISQGGILGGPVVALSPDATNGVLGVPGINYSTLLNRSVDWEGAAVGNLYYASYPDVVDRQLGFALMQMLWDRGEGNGFARRTTSNPLPNSPANRVLLHVAFGDYQVANMAAEVQARAYGARLLQTSLADGRHWSNDPAFRLSVFDRAVDGSIAPHAGSAIVYFDSGNQPPPSVNLPPGDAGGDPHSDPRRDERGTDQRATFLREGTVVDTFDGEPYWTQFCRGPVNPNCP